MSKHYCIHQSPGKTLGGVMKGKDLGPDLRAAVDTVPTWEALGGRGGT